MASSARTSTTSHWIPSLDGVRAVAIGLVLVAHLGGTRGFPLTANEADFFGTGALGVRVFFVLSGFLITGLLLREMGRTGTVSLRAFYARRFFRIFPAYYTYLCLTALAVLVGWEVVRPGDLLHAVTYTENYHVAHGWPVAHAWSLSVEEQFYLLWPVLLYCVGRKRGLLAAAAVVCLAPAIRLAEWYGPHVLHVNVGFTFETVADALAVGALLAGGRERLWSMAWYRKLMCPIGAAAIATAVLLVAAQDRPRLQALVGVTLMNVGIALLIDYFVRMPTGVVGRLLNTSVMQRIGVLSYSIYLWQQPWLDAARPGPLTAFPINLLLTTACATASYYLIETPALAYRRRFESKVAAAAASDRAVTLVESA